jgi:hypothetical protein
MEIATGFTPDAGATHLRIRYVTIVTPLGETQNAEPLEIEGVISPEEVLAGYKRDLLENM